MLTLDHSNEGVTASIIPRLCPTLSPNTVSANPVDIFASSSKLTDELLSHTTGIILHPHNLGLMAVSFIIPVEGCWVDRAQ
jgi:hypothetical protein